MPAKLPNISAPAVSKLEQLGALLRHHRKRLGVSATVAAESAGMSRVTWHRMEQGNPAVTIGAWMQALAVLGLDVEIQEPRDGKPPAQSYQSGWIPLHIKLASYPQLQQLAWHVHGANTFTLGPREALDIYERNGRHLDKTAMLQHERELLAALQEAFGSSHGI